MTQNIKKTAQNMVKWKGFVMWGLLLTCYTLFIINWGLGTGLQGTWGKDEGIFTHYFNSEPASIFNQAINWAVTVGRGIGSIAIGWAIVKFTHKYAAILALILVLFAIPAPWMPHYAGFIIFRTLFAIGGTTLIILVQPIVSAYFSPKTKGKLSLFTTIGYPLGTVITLVPFLGDSLTNTSIINNWQIILTVTGLLFIIPVILYIIIGQKFDTFEDFKQKQANLKQELEAKNGPIQKTSMLSLLKEKETYIWVLFYGGWLVAVVMPFIMARNALPALAGIAKADWGQYRITIVIWLIIFHVAILAGPYTVGLWNRLNAKRKPYIILITFTGIILWILSVIVFIYMVVPAQQAQKSMIAGGWLFYILGFLKGLTLWGIQGVFLNNPHEQEGSNPQKVGIQFSFIWGFGYFFFTIATIILSQIVAIPTSGALIWMIVITLFMLICPLAWLFIKETKPNAPLIPNFKNKK